MKAFEYEVVGYAGEHYCVECLPRGVDVEDEEVDPIFAGAEVNRYPVCCECGTEHDYMSKVDEDDASSNGIIGWTLYDDSTNEKETTDDAS